MEDLAKADRLVFDLDPAGVDREVRSWEKTSDHAPTRIDLNIPAAGH